MSYVPEINRKRQVKSRYGLEPWREELLASWQDYVCALCGEEETAKRNGETLRLAVDHSHDCKCGHAKQKACVHCVRGLLCNTCNRNILPWIEKNSPLANRFTDYIERRPLILSVEERAFTCDDLKFLREPISRRMKVASKHDLGCTFEAIANELNISKSTAHRDYKRWVRENPDIYVTESSDVESYVSEA